MAQNVVVLLTNPLQQFRIGLQLRRQVQSPRLRKRLGVFHCDLKFHVPEVNSFEAFCYPRRFSKGNSSGRDHSAIIEPDCFSNERISLPVPH